MLSIQCGHFSPPSPHFSTPVPGNADLTLRRAPVSARSPKHTAITQHHSPSAAQLHAAHLGRKGWPALLSVPRSQDQCGSVGLLGSLVFSTSFRPNASQEEAESINLLQKTPSWETKATKMPLESLMLKIKSQIIQ